MCSPPLRLRFEMVTSDQALKIWEFGDIVICYPPQVHPPGGPRPPVSKCGGGWATKLRSLVLGTRDIALQNTQSSAPIRSTKPPTGQPRPAGRCTHCDDDQKSPPSSNSIVQRLMHLQAACIALQATENAASSTLRPRTTAHSRLKSLCSLSRAFEWPAVPQAKTLGKSTRAVR